MKWFFRWLRNGINTVDKEDRSDERNMVAAISMPKISVNRNRGLTKVDPNSDGSVHLSASPMNFRIYPATGGHIVEYSYYNDKTDRNDQALHLIPSDLDLGSEIAKIMTLEVFKR